MRLDDLRAMRLPSSHESLSPLPQLGVAAKGARLGNFGAKGHLAVVIEEAQEPIDVAFVPGFHEAVHDLHVLLRHRLLRQAHGFEGNRPRKFREGPDHVSIEEAVEWGRSQADVVVRLGDGDDLGGDEEGHFSAGLSDPYAEMPVWPEGRKVIARPYEGPWTVKKDGYTIP
jgi:hypothetical protein